MFRNAGGPADMNEPARIGPGLHLVATPIGNLRDITLRSLDTLAAADIVVCEDTRVTGKLLAHFRIDAAMLAYNDHNAPRQRPKILAALGAGKIVALVSDAGSPLISDPGYRIVREALAAGFRVESVPGPTAAVAALQVSGLPSDRFFFAGFLPAKSGKRKKALQALANIPSTLIFYESGPRLPSTLGAMAEVFGDREAAVARELTKRFEETARGSLRPLAAQFAEPPKGEIVVVVSGPGETRTDGEDLDGLIRKALAAGESTRTAATLVAARTGQPRRTVYQRALALGTAAKDDGSGQAG